MKRIAVVIAVVLGLASCAPAPTPEPTLPTPTPLELFEAIVAEAREISFSAVSPVGQAPERCPMIVVSEVSYDVEVTTSLVSPFTGTIVYVIDEPPTAPNYQITELYAFQGGAWTLKDTDVDSPYSLVGRGYCTMTKP